MMIKVYEFTVPDGDYDYYPETDTYVWKNLVFTENNWKQAKVTIKDYVADEVPFTMTFKLEEV